MRTKAALVGAFVLVSLLVPARAEHVVVQDPQDTKGRADIRKVRVEDERPRKWVIRTWRRWKVNDFFEKGWFVVYLDTIGDNNPDYYVFVRAKRRRLAAAIWRVRNNRSDVKVTAVKARKAGKAIMKVNVPFRKLRVGKHRVEYKWFVRSIWSNQKCPKLCFDRAPNRGMITEPLIPKP